ncbi:MFS transporter [Rhodococcus sp. NM-2]|uniref:MFS transporter n=1 Tax=Rhodococcus sp. NM-2 TaxID=3401174 RepID=UPI003AAC6806
MFGPANCSYTLFLGLLIAVPLMIFWGRYSTADKIDTLYAHISAQGLTPPGRDQVEVRANGERGPIAACFRNRNINLTALTTMLTQIVYMGVNVVLPACLRNVVGLSLAESAGLSVVFALTGILGQVLWPTLSDVIGRRTTIVVCGIWMAVSVACFYLATSSLLVVLIQLAFGLVANAGWPIYYAAASDAAPEGAVSTANGIITTAMFVGGGIAPLFMGKLISLSGGWGERGGTSSASSSCLPAPCSGCCSSSSPKGRNMIRRSRMRVHHKNRWPSDRYSLVRWRRSRFLPRLVEWARGDGAAQLLGTGTES